MLACVFRGLCLLMQDRSDDCASFGMSLKHQRVQVGQQGVAYVQDITGCFSEGGIPGNRILPLIESRK